MPGSSIILFPTNETSFKIDGPSPINVAPFIYEFIHLCVPAKMTHEEGKCNDKIKDIVSQYLLTEKPELESKSEENDAVDPRWAALKELKNKN